MVRSRLRLVSTTAHLAWSGPLLGAIYWLTTSLVRWLTGVLTMFPLRGSLFLMMVQQSPLMPWVSSGVVQLPPVVSIRLSALPLTWPIGWKIGSLFCVLTWVVQLPVSALSGQPSAGRIVRRGGPLSMTVNVLLQMVRIGTLGRGVILVLLVGSLN